MKYNFDTCIEMAHLSDKKLNKELYDIIDDSVILRFTKSSAKYIIHYNKILLFSLHNEVIDMNYSEEANFIWKNYVPKNGQSDTVQGELLRAIEKLRYEAQNNGNINWDVGFKKFCDYIWDILGHWDKFSNETLIEIRRDLKRILKYKNPYIEDDLYDRLTDHMMEWYQWNKVPIHREIDPNQHR